MRRLDVMVTASVLVAVDVDKVAGVDEADRASEAQRIARQTVSCSLALDQRVIQTSLKAIDSEVVE